MSVPMLLLTAVPLVLALLACGYVLISDAVHRVIERRRR